MRYSQTNRKLQKLFNSIKENESTLKNKLNDQLILEFFRTTIKNEPVLVDSGWISKTPESNIVTSTVFKGDLIPEQLNINFSSELQIPEQIVPYLDVKVLIKTPPDSRLGTFEEYESSLFTGDYIEIKGDSNTLFKSYLTSINQYNTFLSEDFTQYGIDSNRTKQAFQGTIQHNGIPSAPTPGTIIGQVVYVSHTTVVGDIVTTFTSIVDTTPEHVITAISSSGFTAVGDESVDDTSDLNPPVVTQNVTRSLTFASANNYGIKLRTTDLSLDTFNETDVISMSYESIGYWVYYSDLLQKQIVYSKVGNDFQLSNLPDTVDGDTLPYTTISLNRNPEGFPDNLENTTDVFLGFSGTNVINKDLTLFELNQPNEDELPLYYLKLTSRAIIFSPANILNPDENTDVQTDSYTVVGTTYNRTVNNPGTKSLDYVTAKQDVEYKIIVYIKNPLFYQETRRYDVTEQSD